MVTRKFHNHLNHCIDRAIHAKKISNPCKCFRYLVSFCISFSTMPPCFFVFFFFCFFCHIALANWFKVFRPWCLFSILTTLSILTMLIFNHQTICGCVYSKGLVVKQTDSFKLFRLLLGFEIVDARDLQCCICQPCNCISQKCTYYFHNAVLHGNSSTPYVSHASTLKYIYIKHS